MANSKQKLTKDIILEAAFSFYTDLRMFDFSMNELAMKVGVSKPAIYRHFENKEAVLLGMLNHFLDKIAIPLREMRENAKNKHDSVRVPFSETIVFFAENPNYINYLISIFTTNPDFDNIIKKGLLERGIKPNVINDSDLSDVIASFYCGVSILFFLKFREKFIEMNPTKENSSAKVFSERIVDFMLGGLEKSSSKEDFVHPVKISEERMKELDKICSVNKDEFPPEDRFFVALARVILEHTMNGVTIERIASEMNLAKSSLYFYFDNKNQLIKTQIDKELSILTELCRENSAEALNYSEFIYVTMKTEIEYFKMHPSILPICGWLLQNSTNGMFNKCDGVNNVWEKRIGATLQRPDFGFDAGPEILTLWIGILPVSLVPFLGRRGFKDNDFDWCIKKVFNFMQFGLDFKCLQ